ncbi:MAG TPA: type II toxin-antitoxin system VapC family toxin [Terriglobia bacterium]|nr:type II toxin-antitoxin system VapC family toxin [Terriglobia bacterium]
MRAVVDTNVVAYYLLGTEPFVDETRRFWREVGETTAPAIWEAELANVVWMATRSGVLPGQEGPKRLDLAARLGIRSVPSRTLWHGALTRALQSGLAVYDALFVELARRERLPLATFDKKILHAFPAIATPPRALLPDPDKF